MREITQDERNNILKNHKQFDEETLCYWYNKINKRLEFLTPLLDELCLKGIDVELISKELAQEVLYIAELNKLLEMYKV